MTGFAASQRLKVLFPGYLPKFTASISELLLNMHTESYMPAKADRIFASDALRDVLRQPMGKFLLKSIITLSSTSSVKYMYTQACHLLLPFEDLVLKLYCFH